MTKKRRRLWIFLFISVATLLSALATGWNIVLLRDYQHILKLAKNLSLPAELNNPAAGLIFRMIWGTLGFITTLTLTILLFIKLLSEMRLNQIQSEFLATVSHELKTPIATLELSSTLIQAGGLSEAEEAKLWLSHQAELARLRDEVDTLLEAARWQSKPVLTRKIKVRLESWLQESFAHWRTILGPQAVLIREGQELNAEVFLDLKTLNLIANNLVSNARKFSKGVPHVTVRTAYVNSKWQIQFADQGWGFNPADSRKIFHRFFRSRNRAPHSIPGTGLGLYLAQTGSRALGLTLHGESQGDGLGAVFTLKGKQTLSKERL
jgi:signal transduction histidine kinase